MAKKKSRMPTAHQRRRLRLQEIIFIALILVVIASFIITLFM